jgi:ribosome-associated protein
MTDASPRNLLDAVVEGALDVKGDEIVALDVRAITSFADTFVIVTATSDRRARAITDSIREAAARVGRKPAGVEGYDEGRWILIDLDEVIVHVFQREVREQYDLERLWSDAPAIAVDSGEDRIAAQ